MTAVAVFRGYLSTFAVVSAALAPAGLLLAGAIAAGARRRLRRRSVEAQR